MTKIFAGIGSRELPEEIYNRLDFLLIEICGLGYDLYSGGAIGFDRKCEDFYKGCLNRQSTIFTPNKTVREYIAGHEKIRKVFNVTNIWYKALDIASKHHPAWHKITKKHIRNLHARNTLIILGEDLNSPVDFVLCWNKDRNSGGTSQGIRVAEAYDIPVFHMGEMIDEEILKAIIKLNG